VGAQRRSGNLRRAGPARDFHQEVRRSGVSGRTLPLAKADEGAATFYGCRTLDWAPPIDLDWAPPIDLDWAPPIGLAWARHHLQLCARRACGSNRGRQREPQFIALPHLLIF